MSCSWSGFPWAFCFPHFAPKQAELHFALAHILLMLLCAQMASKQRKEIQQVAMDSWKQGVVQAQDAKIAADKKKKDQCKKAAQFAQRQILQRAFRALQESRDEAL